MLTPAELETVIASLEKVRAAVAYSYEAGEYPADMDPVTASYVEGDGGLLNTLDGLIRLMRDCIRWQLDCVEWRRSVFRSSLVTDRRAEAAEAAIARVHAYTVETTSLNQAGVFAALYGP